MIIDQSLKNRTMGNYKGPNTKSKKKDELSNRLSSLSLNEINNDEIQIHKTLITTNKSQQPEPKIVEFNQWWNEQVYDEIDDLDQ